MSVVHVMSDCLQYLPSLFPRSRGGICIHVLGERSHPEDIVSLETFLRFVVPTLHPLHETAALGDPILSFFGGQFQVDIVGALKTCLANRVPTALGAGLAPPQELVVLQTGSHTQFKHTRR